MKIKINVIDTGDWIPRKKLQKNYFVRFIGDKRSIRESYYHTNKFFKHELRHLHQQRISNNIISGFQYEGIKIYIDLR